MKRFNDRRFNRVPAKSDSNRWGILSDRGSMHAKGNTNLLSNSRNNFTGNIKSKGLLNSGKSETASIKNRLGGIQKTVQAVENGKNQLRLFTRHFDARSKIYSKRNETRQLKKALEDVGRENRDQLVNKKRNLNNISLHNTKRERESTFTGNSIQIKTKNNSTKTHNTVASKDRKAMSKGNSISVYANNKSANRQNRKKNKKQFLRSDRATTVSAQSSWMDKPITIAEPLSVSPVRRPVPAKVVISNLHHAVTQGDIQELFGAIGPLREAFLKNIGTAEVIYNTAEDAFAAYSKYHGRNLDGQPMLLKITTADDLPTVQPHGGLQTEGFLAARTSNRNNTQQCYQPPMSSSYTGGESSRSVPSKPVVFTVKL